MMPMSTLPDILLNQLQLPAGQDIMGKDRSSHKEAEKYLREVETIDNVNDNHPTAATKKTMKLKDKCKRNY